MRVSKSLAVRFGAVAATAAIAVSGAAVAANAATAHPAVHKVATALAISETTPVVHRHVITSIIVGRLTAPNENNAPVRFKVIWLEKQGPKGHWFLIRPELTGRHGQVAFRVLVRKSGTFRLAYFGSFNFARAVSAVETVS